MVDSSHHIESPIIYSHYGNDSSNAETPIQILNPKSQIVPISSTQIEHVDSGLSKESLLCNRVLP